MSSRLTDCAALVVASAVLLCVLGCAATPATRPAESGGGAKYVSPGLVGGNVATDRRRPLFDSENERIVRDRVRVGTVVIGGSNMQRWNLAEYFTPADGTIENRGIGGEPVWHTARRFNADVIQLRPRNVVIHTPLNGISGMLSDGKSNEEIAGTLADSIVSMMKAARAAGINVFVLSMIPTNERYRLHEQISPIQAIVNEKLKAACAANGCTYVDVTGGLTDEEGHLRKELTRDGLHVNAEGYAIMAKALTAAARACGVRL